MPPRANPSCLVEPQKGESAVASPGLCRLAKCERGEAERQTRTPVAIMKTKATSQAWLVFALNTQHLPAEAENLGTDDLNGLGAVD